MTNFTIFAGKDFERLVEPFVPGASGHITPIAYQAWTPDIFLFLFRTTDKNNQDHFFVSLETDYIAGPDAIDEILDKWQGVKALEYVTPEKSDTDDEDEPTVKTTGPYKAFLIRVSKPEKLGYWSDHIVVAKDDDLEVAMKEFTPAQRQSVEDLFEENPDWRVAVYKSGKNMEIFYD